MGSENPTPGEAGAGGAGPHTAPTVLPASVDASTATTLASSLRRRRGHVVVTAPFSTTAGRLFEMAEPQLGTARVVRLSARLLVEGEVARAIAGVTQRGLPPPSSAAVAGVVEEAQRQNQSIVLLVEDGDAVSFERLARVREMIERTPAMRNVVRLVLLGSGRLVQALRTPEAKPFVDALALHLNVSSPDPVTVPAAASKAAARRHEPSREPTWLVNEKLLVLAVGAVLVTGVLLFPIEPTVYPDRATPDGAESAPVAAVAPSAPAAAEADVVVPVDAAPADVAPNEGPPVDATPLAAAPAEKPPSDAAPDPDRRFRPPPKPGPALQIGAFRDRENAVGLAERLAADFDGVYIDRLGEGSASLHRVRVSIPGTILGETTLARALSERGFAPIRVE